MTRNGLIVLALAACAGLVWFAAARNTAPPPNAELAEPSEADTSKPVPVAPPPEQPRPKAPTPTTPQPPSDGEPDAPEPATGEPAREGPAKHEIPPPGPAGPIEELRRQFESDPRDSSAHGVERYLRAKFEEHDVPPALIKSVLCRHSVCRVETSWTQDRAPGFMAAFAGLLMAPDPRKRNELFDMQIAIDPRDPSSDDEEHAIDVYIRRLKPGEPLE